MEVSYYTADEVGLKLGIKKATAYERIRKLNKELNEMGYMTVAGKINKRYFEKRCEYNED